MADSVSTIAIDGPVAAGKTVVGRQLAHQLGFRYLDTGVMYRAVGWLARKKNIPVDDAASLGQLAAKMRLNIDAQDSSRVTIGDREVGPELRDPEISRWASLVATVPVVRRSMVQLQRVMADQGRIVMVGRDIGTVVLPQADLKVFMTASVAERARRRWIDLKKLGQESDFGQVLQDTKDRDQRDSTRADSPLIPAADAMTVETDHISAEQAVALILEQVQRGSKRAGK